MAKEVKAFINLQVAAGKATPSPPIGPALGQHGVNIMEFCLGLDQGIPQAWLGFGYTQYRNGWDPLPSPVRGNCQN